MAMADRDPLLSSGSSQNGFEPWPWALAALLAVMIGCSLSLWVIASSYPDGLVGDAWEAGLTYNDDLAARLDARALGMSLEASSTATAGGAGVAVVLMGSAAETVTVARIRPAESGYDETFELELDKAGVWRGEVPLPRAGRWQLEVRARLASGAKLERTLKHWHHPTGSHR